jgi:putative transposase
VLENAGVTEVDKLKKYYWKPMLLHDANYIGTVGGATFETVKKYVEQQVRDNWSANRRTA